jgi:hypothetical protein
MLMNGCPENTSSGYIHWTTVLVRLPVVVNSRTCPSYSFSWSYCYSSAAAVITWALASAITAVAASPSSCCW